MQNPISLRPPEAACLEAIRTGIERKVLIALRAGLTLQQTKRALATLATRNLAVTDRYITWHLTPLGASAEVSIARPVRGRGRPHGMTNLPGAAPLRMLALLDRPRHGANVAELLGVTPQRVHELVVVLAVRGLIRLADPDCPSFAIARKDDPSILLEQRQERVLSAFPDGAATTLSKVAAATNKRAGEVVAMAEALRQAGLIQKTETATYGDLYRLTPAGSRHWQRSATARRAEAPPLSFRSDRVFAVLSYLAVRGPTRTRDIGLALGISTKSMNALMQTLKRKNVVRTQLDAPRAPYELTPAGREMRAAIAATNERVQTAA